MKPKVSVIMPSLNVADYIEECLQSVVGQTLKEIEIICIDAGSTDGTWEILQKYVENTTIKLLHSDRKSYGYQVNIGIREAKGEYIAILETDDFVEPVMYEMLYHLAESHQADFVKADYDSFLTLDNGKPFFKHVKMWQNETGNYNYLLCPNGNLYLYVNDISIWRGIYKKSFLVDNHICCNESPGAAYQDIGFVLQVLACARRAYYTDESYYRYRMDRVESSINSLNGVRYVFQEFERLLEDEDINQKIAYKEGLYYRLVQSFLCEYRKTLIAVQFDTESEYLKPYYEWFREKIITIWVHNVFSLDFMEKTLLQSLKMLLYDLPEYVNCTKETEYKNQKNKEELLNSVRGKKVFVFGAGQRGKRIVDILIQMGIEPVNVCDNDERTWGNKVYGTEIVSPKECVNRCLECGGTFVIANKNHENEIAIQLLEMEVSESQIVKTNQYMN